jgi:hypothetical protein
VGSNDSVAYLRSNHGTVSVRVFFPGAPTCTLKLILGQFSAVFLKTAAPDSVTDINNLLTGMG